MNGWWVTDRLMNAAVAVAHVGIAAILIYIGLRRRRIVGDDDYRLPLLLGVFAAAIFPSRLARVAADGAPPHWWLVAADVLAAASSVALAVFLCSHARRMAASPSLRRFAAEVELRREAEGRLFVANMRMKARLVTIQRQRNALMAVLANSSLTPEQQKAVKELVEALN